MPQLQELVLEKFNQESLYTTPLSCELLIIGGGPAGLTAALYAARDGVDVILLEGEVRSNTELPGGQLMLTPEIENFPGFPSGSGEDLIETMRDQALSFGAKILEEYVLEINTEDVLFAKTRGNTYTASSMIIATGAVARRLGVTGEDQHFGRGVSVCATCDGAFFRGKDVAVIGGGDTAVEDALFLTKFASSVSLMVRKDTLRTTSPEARAVLASDKINVVWNTTVEAVHGDTHVTHIDTIEDGKPSRLDVQGVFVAIGHDPATKFLHPSILRLSGEGYLLSEPGKTHTNVPGVFAAGDVTDEVYKQAITAAASGCQAALDAERYLRHVLGR